MNTNREERTYDIVGGPNKDALFDACKYAYAKDATVTVAFDVAFGYTMPKGHPSCAYMKMNVTDFVIAGIEHEDGSGDSFNIHGYCKCDAGDRFRAYYNAKLREGSISFF